MTNYQYLIIGGGMTAAAAVDGSRTPAAIVREIKERLGLNTRTCKGQPAKDRDAAAVIGISATVSLVRDGRKRKWDYESNPDD